MSDTLDVRIEWLDAPNVVTPELAATWARYEIWVDGSCVTRVEASDGTFRRGVYGSLYPLAVWVASNWWILAKHIRPSAVESRYWRWRNVRTYRWLRSHNFRAAGDGMAWPDLTLVGEGPVTRVTWSEDHEQKLLPIKFVSSGVATLRSSAVAEGLAALVQNVLDRLSEMGLQKTTLFEEWAAIANADEEEQAFCETMAQMGLDPYSTDDDLAGRVVDISATLPEDLARDFFDTANAGELDEAVEWTKQALTAAESASRRADHDLSSLQRAVMPLRTGPRPGTETPWGTGYAMARKVRETLNLSSVDKFDAGPWVGTGEVGAPAGGLQGLAAVAEGRCGLVLGGFAVSPQTQTFKKAQAIGRAISQPDRHTFLISSARSQSDRIARAFAAELLAPADGIRELIGIPGGDIDAIFERVSEHFQVSPFVVRHQFENQLTTTFGS